MTVNELFEMIREWKQEGYGNFQVTTYDRDYGDTTPFATAEPDEDVHEIVFIISN